MRQARSPHATGQTWSTFLKHQAQDIWACDFLSVVDLFFRQALNFFILQLILRRVIHCEVTRVPADAWVEQQLRKATPFGQTPHFLIRDRESKYGDKFARVPKGSSIEILKTP